MSGNGNEKARLLYNRCTQTWHYAARLMVVGTSKHLYVTSKEYLVSNLEKGSNLEHSSKLQMQFKDIIKRQIKLVIDRPIGNHLKVEKTDTFIVAYPRSGSSWSRFLLGSLVAHEFVDWESSEKVVPDIYRNSQKQLNKISSPRILRSHHSYDKRYPKVIYIVRNVEDVLLSYYRLNKKYDKHYSNEDISTFIEKFMNGSLDDFGSWGENVQSWISNANKIENGFLLVKYEDLKEDTFKELNRIVKFLSIHRTEDEINRAIRWSSKENMSKLEKAQSDIPLFKESKKDISFVSTDGNPGIRNEIGDENIEKVKNRFRQQLIELDYSA